MFLVRRLISVAKIMSSSSHWARDQEESTPTYAPRLYKQALGYDGVDCPAEAFLIDIARMATSSFCFMAEKEVESPRFMGYSTPRLLKVPSDFR